jgi:NADH-quinone oxidoreductase subunit N
MFNVAEEPPAPPPAGNQPTVDRAAAEATRATENAALQPARDYLWHVLAFLAVITCTFGNLAAYAQTNIKRLLAYSTIAQAGYMIMPVPAAMVLAGSDPVAARAALSALAFYAGVYLFMNLGAFAVVAFLRNTLHSEEIADYAGLIRRSPILTLCFATLLISLIGLPPLAGFAGKLLIFYYLVEAKLWAVLVIAGLNTAISLYYYLRVVKIMTIDPEPENRLPVQLSLASGTFVVAMTLPVVWLGIGWDQLNRLALTAAEHLF